MLGSIHTIWLADDDEDDLGLFKEALLDVAPDVELVSFVNGSEIINQLRSSPTLPDVVLLDINMPKKNGFDCLSEIKGDPKLSSLATIMWSTAANPNHAEQAFQLGARLFVKKPDTFTRLTAITREILTANLSDPYTYDNEFLIE
ncbi:response regulator [Parachryseolinea silvisoli]|uniref:response regulator n=1 Tax=Parachryseolinea silvisoli TaxID=2873601 RepID=UPI002265813E|nr:response regulator [Parachryseolinea silvisoli]MCD9015167.1 response regulator [Parachryseolinea silvisoli]